MQQLVLCPIWIQVVKDLPYSPQIIHPLEVSQLGSEKMVRKDWQSFSLGMVGSFRGFVQVRVCT